jgi:hypothetical protein
MTLRKQEHIEKLKRKHSIALDVKFALELTYRKTNQEMVILFRSILPLEWLTYAYFANEEVSVKNFIRSPWRKESARKIFRKGDFRK